MNKEQWEFLLGDWQDCRESHPSSIETKSAHCSQHFSKQGILTSSFSLLPSCLFLPRSASGST